MRNDIREISLNDMEITDGFWKQYLELVRKEVIPYQWEALNDRVPGAEPSYCMRNFKIAAKLTKERYRAKSRTEVPILTSTGFVTLPEKGILEDRFYGFLFQDSDFSKWIEAVGYSLTQHPDAELEKVADEAIDIVCAAQQEDGYLDTYYIINNGDKRFSNLRDNHELYCFGHLAEGAIAYYQATGKDKLLQAVVRFADYIYDCFGSDEGKLKGYPGHELAEMALMRLYELTGKEKYCELARFFIDERGKRPYYFDQEKGLEKPGEDEERYEYNQAHRPVRKQEEARGHAVRAVYLYSGMADVAKYTGDEEMLAACKKLWENIVQKKMYITAGIGATHHWEAFSFNYDLPNDTIYAETCASIGLAFFAKRMLNIEPLGEYGDVLERALYNGIISGMSLDGKSFFYVNPLEVLPIASAEDPGKKHVAIPRQKWFGCACCPPNLARIISSIAQYGFSYDDHTIYMHLYMGGNLKKEINGVQIEIEISSNYPWDESVEIKFKQNTPVNFTYAVRIPGWSTDAKVCVNGSAAEGKMINGYFYINREWKNGDVIELILPMEAVLCSANPQVREDIGKLAVMRGPLVYCMEEADNGKDLHLYELEQSARFEEKKALKPLNGMTMLVSTAKKRVYAPQEEQTLYRRASRQQYEDTSITWIPYYAWANRGAGEMQVWIREHS